MKKILSLILAMAISVTALSFCADSVSEYKGYPVVLVPGYASASLCYDENGETKAAWGWEINDIIPPVMKSAPEIVRGVTKYSYTKNDELLNKSVADCLLNLLDAMRCNPDGTSVRNVHPVLVRAEETCDSYMNREYPDGDYRVELDMTKALDELVGEENVFYFNCDFRMSAVDCANDLNAYIEDVKSYTGSDKVNIVAVSHGGLITATYLSLYLDKNDLYNVVMDEPALTGAGIASDLIKGECDFDEETMVRYLEYHSVCENDYNWAVRAHQLGFLDDILEEIVSHAKEGVLYWTSLWDFMAPDVYEELKAENLDSVESAALIEKSDYVHYNVMANYKKIFADAQKAGIRVNIIAGCGNRILSGQNSNSDGIITVKSSTGAECAPFGKRFSEAYVQNAIENGRIISPSMDIDITEGYLPENTWLVKGLFHGMEFWDTYSRNLLFRLILTDTPVDVNTFKEYPQFRDTSSATQDVYAEFSECGAGYITPEAKMLTVTNCSESRTAYILSVKSRGVELDFDISDIYSVLPGQSVSIPVSGKLPDGLTYSEITVNYIMLGSLTPLCKRSQIFTAVNGESAENSDDGLIDAGFPTDDNSQSKNAVKRLTSKLGIQELASIIKDADAKKFFRYLINQ